MRRPMSRTTSFVAGIRRGSRGSAYEPVSGPTTSKIAGPLRGPLAPAAFAVKSATPIAIAARNVVRFTVATLPALQCLV